MSQCTSLFTEWCWFQKLLKITEQVLDDNKKWLTLSNNDHFTPECLKKMCENLDKQHINLLLHTEIRWFSGGRVLNGIFWQKGELQDYFQENSRPDFAKCFEGEKWLEQLASLAYIFYHMNQLNKSLKGPGENIFDFM
jgi:hypothetical protein